MRFFSENESQERDSVNVYAHGKNTVRIHGKVDEERLKKATEAFMRNVAKRGVKDERKR